MPCSAPVAPRTEASTGRFDRALLADPEWLDGTVLRIHPRAVVVVAEPPDRGLTLLAPGADLVARSIALPDLALPWAPGQVVRLAGRRLDVRAGARSWTWRLVGPGVSLRLDDGGPHRDLPRCARAPDPSTWPGRTRALLAAAGPLAGGPATVAERIDAALRQGLGDLVQALRSPAPDPERLRDRVSALTGLGTGSTPAGDDLLVGVIAGAWRLGLRDALDAVARVVAGLPPGATTETAQRMVVAALRGDLPEALCDAARALDAPADARGAWTSAVQRLERMGHGSGAEMLAGLLALSQPEGVNDR
jgi:hypothetical protein